MVKANEFFQAAKLALSHGLLNACVQDCYYAMFWATVAMLEWTGHKRAEWSHGEIRRYFGLVLVRQWHLCPARWGEWLQEVYKLRIKAAYKPESVFKNEAQRALRYAETFVNKALEVRK
ncbi:MAG: HEPN domain-containing protein [Armatimonadetes bacterium]|nr:HEPN domain-containing protein [Armatimonadota bacterium]